MTIKNEDLLCGVLRIAAVFMLTPQQVYHLMDKHGLPTFKIGRIVCANAPAVREWLRQREAVGRTGKASG
ncbi:DNA-binding protein [Methylobacterium bullatum]|uniref:Helix-turn-helix domain-containing protein n=1 Tax=Methylobacterium bullatum TaxID=570505 RepID=A0A679JME5_9HYPH|nr:hypothetical protein MBLL_00793 [Methylobacterium bullatum]